MTTTRYTGLTTGDGPQDMEDEMDLDAVIAKLEKLAVAHELDAKLLNDASGGTYATTKPSNRRDRYVAHEASATSFELAVQLLRNAMVSE